MLRYLPLVRFLIFDPIIFVSNYPPSRSILTVFCFSSPYFLPFLHYDNLITHFYTFLNYKKLKAQPELLTQAQQQHIDYFFYKMVAWESGLKGIAQLETVPKVIADFDNLLLALENACNLHQFDSLLSIFPTLEWLLVFTNQRHKDVIPILQRLSQYLEETPELRISMLHLNVVFYLLRYQEWENNHKEAGIQYLLVQTLLKHFNIDSDILDSNPQFLFSLSLLEFTFNNRSKALSLAKRSLNRYKQKQILFGQGRVLSFLGILYLDFKGDLETARHVSKQSLEIQKKIGDAYGEVESLNRLSLLAWYQSKFAESKVYIAEALILNKKMNFKLQLYESYAHGGWVHLLCGEPKRARDSFQAQYEGLQELGYDSSWALFALSMSNIDKGDYLLGQSFGLKSLQNTQSQLIKTYALGQLARATLATNSNHKAQTFINEAVLIIRKINQPDELAYKLGVLALTQISLESFEDAKTTISEALSIVLKTRSFKITFALVAASMFRLAQGNILEAVHIYAVASQHSYVTGSKWFADVAGTPIEGEAKKLPKSAVESAKKQGQEADMWTVAESLLQEFKSVES